MDIYRRELLTQGHDDMAASTENLQWRITKLEETVEKQAEELQAIETRNADRDRERIALEQKRLLWGISALGAVVMALLGMLWQFRSLIVNGRMP